MRLAITSRKQTPTELRIEDVFDTVWRVIGGRRCLLLPPEEAQLRLDLARLLVDLETLPVSMEGAASGDPKARTLVLGRRHYHL